MQVVSKGKYGCLPGYAYSSGSNIKVYKVPGGQRRLGVLRAEWSDRFLSVSYLSGTRIAITNFLLTAFPVLCAIFSHSLSASL